MRIIHLLVLAGLLVSISCADDSGPGGIDSSTKLVDLTLAETEELCNTWHAETKDYLASLSVTDLCTARALTISATVIDCEQEVDSCRPEAAENLRSGLNNLSASCATFLGSVKTTCPTTVGQFDACVAAGRANSRKIVEEASCENAGNPLPENDPEECAFLKDGSCLPT